MTWMVGLGGLGYVFAAWEADGIIWEASGWYLEVPGRYGISPGGPQILRRCPVEGNSVGSGGRKAYNLNEYKLTIYMLTRL